MRTKLKKIRDMIRFKSTIISKSNNKFVENSTVNYRDDLVHQENFDDMRGFDIKEYGITIKDYKLSRDSGLNDSSYLLNKSKK